MIFNTFNIEVLKWKKILVIGFYDGNHYYSFKTIKSFIKFLDCRSVDRKSGIKKEKYIIYAHNGGRFDFIFLMEYLIKIKKQAFIKRIILNHDRVFSFRYKNIEFRDSYLLFYCSLRKITYGFDVKHKKFMVNYDSLETEDYKSYCFNNCLGLYECISEYIKLFKIEKKIPLTLSSLSLQTFLKKYISIDRLSGEKNEFIRKAYFGGRVEIYKKREKNKIFVYDCNSLYPFVMQNNLFPIDKGVWVYHCKDFNLLKDYIGFIEAKIKVYKNNITLFPARTKKGITYSYGEWTGVFSTILLKELVDKKLGEIIEIKKVLIFLKTAKIFSSFILSYWNKRKKAVNSGINYMYKLFMNSLYGKFAERREGEQFIFNPSGENIIKKDMDLYSERIQLYHYTTTRFVSCENVSISALITDYARLYIYNNLKKYESNLFYTDTDSLHLNKKLMIEEKDVLGGFKLEKIIEDVLYLQPKAYLYTYNSIKKACVKGFEHFTLNKKMKLLRFSTFKYMIKNKLGSYIIEKELKSQYDKRTLKNGIYLIKKIKINEFFS